MRFTAKIVSAIVIAFLLFTIIWIDRQKAEVEELREKMVRPATSIDDAFRDLDKAAEFDDSFKDKTILRWAE